jgi:hypothetical protein
LCDSSQDARRWLARKNCLHSEEVGVEDWGEAYLLDCDLREDGEDFRWVVEVVSKEEEPVYVSLARFACTPYHL